ncbi:hypothetical protein Leryth_020242 [Lithospermum erythrorhizon]|nr:hypothetical protein Leryth_020242 [Lithospermum erythrorhizon]
MVEIFVGRSIVVVGCFGRRRMVSRIILFEGRMVGVEGGERLWRLVVVGELKKKKNGEEKEIGNGHVEKIVIEA